MSNICIQNCNFGKGVFAAKKIFQGECIVHLIGKIISLEQALEKPINKASYPLQIDEKVYIDLEEPAVFVNHSCLPNAGIICDRMLIALKDIEVGEEIAYDYSTTMDEDNWTLACQCGSPHCRGVVKDFKYLAADLQEKYFNLGTVQSFIKKKYVG